MKMNYLARIQHNLKLYQAIPTNVRTTRLLDGSYHSIFKGRGLNFDELREYVTGDEIRDIDWKASARSQKLLVRQYIAEKRHNIMLVPDTNARMEADSMEGITKREVALLSTGTLAYLANKEGDYISATFAKGKSISHFPFKNGDMNLENILCNYDKAAKQNQDTDLNAALEFILHHMKRSMILVIATDLSGMCAISDRNLKLLEKKHDVMLIHISDALPMGKGVYDLAKKRYIPAFFSRNEKLMRHEMETREELLTKQKQRLKNFGIACATIDHTEEIDTQLMELLNAHKFQR